MRYLRRFSHSSSRRDLGFTLLQHSLRIQSSQPFPSSTLLKEETRPTCKSWVKIYSTRSKPGWSFSVSKSATLAAAIADPHSSPMPSTSTASTSFKRQAAPARQPIRATPPGTTLFMAKWPQRRTKRILSRPFPLKSLHLRRARGAEKRDSSTLPAPCPVLAIPLALPTPKGDRASQSAKHP